MRLGNAAVGDGSLVAAAVTLVVPALNEVEHLPALLADAASFPVDEIIVVDNGSTDATGDVARQMGATVVSESVRGKGHALRAGLAEAKTPLVFCCDADIVGLDAAMIATAVDVVRTTNAPMARLHIRRPAESAPVTTLLARPYLDCLGFACNEPLGGLFAADVRWLSGAPLPGNWAFDFALTMRLLEQFGQVMEIPVQGVVHRTRPLAEYEAMATEILAWILDHAATNEAAPRLDFA